MDTDSFKNTVAEAFHRTAARYDQPGVDFFTPMGRRLVELVAPWPGARVLDVGCGRGAVLFPAASAVGAGQVTGIDIAPAMVEEGRREAARQGRTNITLKVMDAENPRFPAGSFDIVTASFSLIFLPDAPAALARYGRVLTGAGRIGFTSPVFAPDVFPYLPPAFTELIPPAVVAALPPHYQPDRLRARFDGWLTDASDLRRTLRDRGFHSIEIRDEPVDMVIDSGAAWVEWSYSKGMRLIWDNLPERERALLRERLITGLDDLRGDQERLTVPMPVRFATAVAR